jgi:type 1 glutamine amidotransferase
MKRILILPCLGILFFLFSAVVSLPTAAAEGEDGFKSIFNGKDLKNWDGDAKFWRVEDGAIVGQTTPENPTKGNTFIIWKDGNVDDFELQFSYRITANNDQGFANSGAQYRSKRLNDWVVGGYQADFEAGNTYSGIVYEERGPRGIMAQRGQRVVWNGNGKKDVSQFAEGKELQDAIKKEDWNDYHVIAKGTNFKHYINGKLMCEVTDNDAKNRVFSGILALQLHAGQPMKVEFKNIRLRRTRLADVDGMKDRKKIVIVAGRPSHGAGEHEFNAGSLLLKKCLDENVPYAVTQVYDGGWPSDPTAFDNADTIMLYMDGGGGHPLIQTRARLAEIDQLMKQGVGMVCAHYAVEVPKEKGGPDLLNWIGGYFETYWSVNPHWMLKNAKLAENHPITRGVKPFEMQDEWYYHMRFRENMKGVTPILAAVPPDSTRERPDDAHGGNPHVRARKGEPEIVAWAVERDDGGRGFGYTGGHFHKNWGDPNNRKLFLNALLWTAKAEVPENGVESKVTPEDLAQNLDNKRRR